MQSIVAAFFICLISAISRIMLKRGMHASNALTGMVVSLVIGWIVLAGLTLALVSPSSYNLKGILFFSMIGIIAPPVVRYLTYIGIDRLGASRSDQLRSLTPFFAIYFAVIFLNEPLNAAILAGTVCIFSGVLLISHDGLKNQQGHRRWHLLDLFPPILAALLAGVVANLRKYGNTLLDSPLLAATVAATSALFVFGTFMGLTGNRKKLQFDATSSKYFILSGICTSATDVLDLVALKSGKVSVVIPLLATSPLFVIILSHLFLKGIEKVTWIIVLSGLLIVAGVELILIFGK